MENPKSKILKKNLEITKLTSEIDNLRTDKIDSEENNQVVIDFHLITIKTTIDTLNRLNKNVRPQIYNELIEDLIKVVQFLKRQSKDY
tara:strand:+ start:224 stop:487 length:264 start_codon:yes stop_codon:yes gene_type:complete